MLGPFLPAPGKCHCQGSQGIHQNHQVHHVQSCRVFVSSSPVRAEERAHLTHSQAVCRWWTAQWCEERSGIIVSTDNVDLRKRGHILFLCLNSWTMWLTRWLARQFSRSSPPRWVSPAVGLTLKVSPPRLKMRKLRSLRCKKVGFFETRER